MNYDITSILKHIAYIEKAPNRWGYTKISNKVREYAVKHNAAYDDELLPNDWSGMADNEGAFFIDIFEKTFTQKQLYFILKNMLEELHLDELLNGMILYNAEEYEETSIGSIPNLKQQLEETKRALSGKYYKTEEYLTKAFTKLVSGIEIRNALDDLRFSIEQLLQVIYSNGKTFENNITQLRQDIKNKGIEPHVASMVGQLLTLFADYQNSNVKHKDTFNDDSADFIFDITATLIKFIAKLF